MVGTTGCHCDTNMVRTLKCTCERRWLLADQ
jgi:hypothetical protein